MKYIVILGDGMPDHPIPEWNGMTPLEKAQTPNLDRLTAQGELGLVDVIPEGLPPGSDVGHLSVLGYDPHKYYTGRAPIEAVAMKIPLGKNDIAFRCNLVRLDEENGKTLMGDFTAGHISNDKGHPLIQKLNETLAKKYPDIHFYPGVSYRHLMVWKNGKAQTVLTPPHDLTDKSIAPGLPQG
ncbi:MAG: phosphoglycerate mutase, partial [bacterium]|nr:phosphoglycerate mutase [bacterium]